MDSYYARIALDKLEEAHASLTQARARLAESGIPKASMDKAAESVVMLNNLIEEVLFHFDGET